MVAGAVLLVVAVAAAWYALGRPRQDPAAAVDVVPATRGTQTQTVSLAGTIRPQDQATVSFKVPGTVRTVSVKVGDKVKAGQTLATVGTRDLSDAVVLARANVSAARAQLSSVRKADEVTQAQIDAARAQVRSAEASLASAQNRLADATLKAPVAGTIAQVSYGVGDEVAGSAGSLGSALGGSSGDVPGLGGAVGGSSGASGATPGQIVIVSTDAWQLDASVGTADLPSLKAGQKASITPTGTTTTVTGTVDTVGIVATQTGGAAATFPVTIAVDRVSDRLYSGSSADAVVTVGAFPGVLTVPEGAVSTADGKAEVRVVRGTVVTARQVTTGRHFTGRVEITSGLAAGDRVEVPRGVVVSRPSPPQFGPAAAPTR